MNLKPPTPPPTQPNIYMHTCQVGFLTILILCFNNSHKVMGSIGKVEVEMELKSSSDKFWEAIRDSITLFPKIFPEQYKSIEVLEGDGKSVGSIRLIKFADGIPIVTFSKEKIEAVDEANKTLAYSVIDGELANFFKNFKANLIVSSKGDQTLVKWSSEFEKASGEAPDPSIMKEFAVKNFQDLDDYLIKV